MRKKVRVPDLIRMRKNGDQITMLTAYDFTFSRLLDSAGIDILLVGDSLASVVQGSETTLAVTLDEMIYHSRLVVRGAERALVVADMPFMSSQVGPKETLINAGRLIKEAGVSAVKIEGGVECKDSIAQVVAAGIPVMGHVGLRPQSFHQMGGHRIQGRQPDQAAQIIADARAVQAGGAFAVVLEGIPSLLAQKITLELEIPTIGIGAGPGCSGQVLVSHDLLGLTVPFSGDISSEYSLPKFVKRYLNLQDQIRTAVSQYRDEVQSRKFPGNEHSYSSPALDKVSNVA